MAWQDQTYKLALQHAATYTTLSGPAARQHNARILIPLSAGTIPHGKFRLTPSKAPSLHGEVGKGGGGGGGLGGGGGG